MRLPVTTRFLEDFERYDFRYRCEDCAHFVPPRGCGHGYPTDDHTPHPTVAKEIVFCKEFEFD